MQFDAAVSIAHADPSRSELPQLLVAAVTGSRDDT